MYTDFNEFDQLFDELVNLAGTVIFFFWLCCNKKERKGTKRKKEESKGMLYLSTMKILAIL